jgi:hypothetical protein
MSSVLTGAESPTGWRGRFTRLGEAYPRLVRGDCRAGVGLVQARDISCIKLDHLRGSYGRRFDIGAGLLAKADIVDLTRRPWPLVIIATDGGVVNTSGQPQDVVLLVDIANVMGSIPDGWWRDRAGAATRLLKMLEHLNGADVTLSDGLRTARIAEVRAVVEGAARSAEGPEAVAILRADRDGDSEIVEEANRLAASGATPLVVTADRGLQRRLPEGALIAGPGWLNRLLGR